MAQRVGKMKQELNSGLRVPTRPKSPANPLAKPALKDALSDLWLGGPASLPWYVGAWGTCCRSFLQQLFTRCSFLCGSEFNDVAAKAVLGSFPSCNTSGALRLTSFSRKALSGWNGWSRVGLGKMVRHRIHSTGETLENGAAVVKQIHLLHRHCQSPYAQNDSSHPMVTGSILVSTRDTLSVNNHSTHVEIYNGFGIWLWNQKPTQAEQHSLDHPGKKCRSFNEKPKCLW